jgi:hypothetical protein
VSTAAVPPLDSVFLPSPTSYLLSKAVQAPIAGYTTDLPEAAPTKGIFVLDTRELFSALEGENSVNQSNLERVCRLLGFKPEYLHNAGNDAHVRASN